MKHPPATDAIIQTRFGGFFTSEALRLCTYGTAPRPPLALGQHRRAMGHSEGLAAGSSGLLATCPALRAALMLRSPLEVTAQSR